MIHCAAIFTDHMLLQRGKPIAVFGTGTAGEPVTVSVPQRTVPFLLRCGRTEHGG